MTLRHDPPDLPLDASPGPARRISSARTQAMIEAALDAFESATPRPRQARRWRSLLIAALVLGAIGAAAAAAYRLAVGPTAAPERRDLEEPKAGATVLSCAEHHDYP